MTKKIAEKIVRGIKDKIEANTVDMNDWAKFWGFTVDEYEDFLDMAIKALSQEPCEDCLANEPCEDWHDVPSDEMTLEQARQAVKDLRKIWAKYLEQEPCEDCISRKAAQAKIKSICDEYGLSYEDGERKVSTGGSAYALGHALDDLPPIQPKSKVGKWITQWELKQQIEYYVCSECREEFSSDAETGIGMCEYKYCPNCGAKMEVE